VNKDCHMANTETATRGRLFEAVDNWSTMLRVTGAGIQLDYCDALRQPVCREDVKSCCR